MDTIEKLKEWWASTNSGIVTSYRSEADVQICETGLGIMFPQDFREYLVQACPIKEQSDTHLTCWWQMERLEKLSKVYKHMALEDSIIREPESYIVFADFCEWSWAWAIHCGDGPIRGQIVLIGGNPDHIVAGDFTTFVELYTHKPELVY